MAPTMKLGFSLPVAGAWATPGNQVRVAQEAERLGYHSPWDVRRYAELGLTELFLEANLGLHGWPVEQTLQIMAALAPERCLPAG